MPRIDTHERSVPLARVGQPQIPSGWFTDEYRAQAQAAGAEAQFGRALGQAGQVISQTIGGLIQQLQDQQARTEIRKANVAMSTRTTALLIEHADPKWRDSQYGTGFVTSSDGTPTEIKKKPLSQYAQDFMGKYDKIRDDVFANSFTAAPESTRQQWLAGTNLDRNQQALRINSIQVQVAQQQAELAVYEVGQAHLTAFEAGRQSAEDTRAGIEQTKERGYATGDLRKTVASEKQFDAMIAKVGVIEKQLEQAAEEAEVGIIVDYLNNSELTYDQKLEVVATHAGLNGQQKRDAVSQINMLEAANKARREVAAETERADLFNALAATANPLTRDYVESKTNLSENEQQQFWAWAQDIAAAKAKGKKSIFETADPAVQLAVGEAIDLTPDSRTEAEWRTYIYSWVGKGLPVTGEHNIEHYINRVSKALKPGSIAKNPAVKNAHTVLNKLRDNQFWLSEEAKERGKFTAEDEKQMLLKWMEISSAFDNWLEQRWGTTGSHPTDEEIQNKLDALTAPAKEEIKKSAFWQFVKSAPKAYVKYFTPVGGLVTSAAFWRAKLKEKGKPAKAPDPLGLR